MSAVDCTLDGRPVLRAAISIPKAGIWGADVELGAGVGEKLEGRVTLALAGQSFKGTIVDGGPHEGRGWYRIVGGAAGWRTEIKPLSYRAAGGVKASTILGDAAREAGEDLADFDDWKVGPYFASFLAPGARVLDAVAVDKQPEKTARGWYVDVDGRTYVGARPAVTWSGKHVLLDKQPAAARLMIAPETLVGLVPGAIVEGLEATSIRHELGEGGLRTHVYAAQGVSKRARLRAAFERLVRRIVHELLYQRSFAYRVVSQAGGYLDLQPMLASDNLPPLKNVAMWVGIPGGRGKPAVGSAVRVSFTNGDPTLPYIVSYDGEANAGWKPTHAGIEASTQADLWAATVTLGDSSAVALAKAQLALDNFSNLKTWLDAHVHTGVTPGVGSSAGPPVAGLSPSPTSMATTKVKGT